MILERYLDRLLTQKAKSSSSSRPIGLSPVGANHLRDQIFPRPPILRKVEQIMSTALTPFRYVI
jgi:hypothetical protein